MKKATYSLLGVSLSVILFIVFSPKAEGVSNNPCSPCHPFPNGAYDQYLDILENDVQTEIPSEIDKEQTKTVSVIIENGGSPGDYDIISSVSLSISSQHGFFSVDSKTQYLGEMSIGKRSAVWQITGFTDGFDTIQISATGTNLHGLSQFSDTYSIPITVGQPTSTPTPTPTQTPDTHTNTNSNTHTNTNSNTHTNTNSNTHTNTNSNTHTNTNSNTHTNTNSNTHTNTNNKPIISNLSITKRERKMAFFNKSKYQLAYKWRYTSFKNNFRISYFKK